MSNSLNERELLDGIRNRYANCDSYHERGTLRFSLYQKEVAEKPALDQDCLIETFFKGPSSLKSTWRSGVTAQQKTSGILWSDATAARLYSYAETKSGPAGNEPPAESHDSHQEADRIVVEPTTGTEIAFKSLAEMLSSDQLGMVNLPVFMPLLLTQPEILKEFEQPVWTVSDTPSPAHPQIETACWIITEETLPTTRSYWINKEDFRVEAMLFDFRARFWESELVNKMIGTLSQAAGILLRKPEWTLTGKSMGHRMFTQFYRIEEAHFNESVSEEDLRY